MKMTLIGYERVVPKSGKQPFTWLYGRYQKQGVTGEKVEGIYVSDGFILPTLTACMVLDIDRDGQGYLLAVTEIPKTLKINN